MYYISECHSRLQGAAGLEQIAKGHGEQGLGCEHCEVLFFKLDNALFFELLDGVGYRGTVHARKGS